MLGHTTLLLLLLLAMACARPVAKPDAGTFADRVEATIRREAPWVAVVRLDEARLQMTWDAGTVVLGLDNLRAQCATFPDKCDSDVARQVRGAMSAADPTSRRATRENIRAAVKNDAWLTTVATTLGIVDAGDARAPLTRRWDSELTVVYVIDLPDSVAPLSRGAQRELGLDDKDIDRLAMKNLEAALPQPTLTELGGYDGIYAIYDGDDYCTSQLLFPARFAPLAKKLGGQLVLAAPIRNALLATGRADAETLATLRKLAEENAASQAHPLSTTLFDWSPSGFTARRAR